MAPNHEARDKERPNHNHEQATVAGHLHVLRLVHEYPTVFDSSFETQPKHQQTIHSAEACAIQHCGWELAMQHVFSQQHQPNFVKTSRATYDFSCQSSGWLCSQGTGLCLCDVRTD